MVYLAILNKLSYEHCYQLSVIFTNIISSGIFTNIWNKSYISYIQKGDPSFAADYTA